MSDFENTKVKVEQGWLQGYEEENVKIFKGILCDYIAHPDVILWGYPRQDESVREVAGMIADISLRYNMPLELNCGSGVRKEREYEDGRKYPYPNRIFFEEFSKRGMSHHHRYGYP